MQDTYAKLSSAAVQNQAPITLQLWHGFTGREQEALEALAEEFNASAGMESRIQLVLTGFDSLPSAADAVFQAAREEAEKTDDLPRLPDLFFSLDDTAYLLDRMGWAVHMEEFLTEEQRGMFLDSVQAESCPGENGSMLLFPIGIDTDILLLNETSWSKFCRETETTREDGPAFTDMSLSTWEGVMEAANAYQNWASSDTTEVFHMDDTESGNESLEERFDISLLSEREKRVSFFCTDSWGRLLTAGYEGLGKHMFVSDLDGVRFSFDRSHVRSFWNFWSYGWMDGIFSQSPCKDAFGSGEAVACLTSTAQAISIAGELPSGAFRIGVQAVPAFSGGNPVTMQETLGLVLTKSSKEKQTAAQIFLQWMLSKEHIADIAVAGGRLPALKQATADSVLSEAFKRQGLSATEQMILKQAKKQLYSHIQLPLAVFDGGSSVIDTMDELLLSGGKTVQRNYLLHLADEEEAGMVRTEMTNDFAYEEWYLSFRDSVVDLVLIGRKAA